MSINGPPLQSTMQIATQHDSDYTLGTWKRHARATEAEASLLVMGEMITLGVAGRKFFSPSTTRYRAAGS